jgi:hypothetical protein
MIDRTYGHLAPDAEEYERGLLDALTPRLWNHKPPIQV